MFTASFPSPREHGSGGGLGPSFIGGPCGLVLGLCCSMLVLGLNVSQVGLGFVSFLISFCLGFMCVLPTNFVFVTLKMYDRGEKFFN